jgi:hypothetical protein
MQRLTQSAIIGAVAGAAGTLAMDLVWYRRYRTGGGVEAFGAWETSEGTDKFEDAPAPARTAKAVADMVGIELPDSTARALNNVVHWATGIGWGQAHGVAATALRTTSPILGPMTAVTAWATSYVVLPKLGVYRPMSEYDRDVLWQDLSAHLAFGVVLGVTYRLLRGAPGD